MRREPDRDFFLLTAMDWAALRSASPPDSRAYALATIVSREAAICHLLFQAGKTVEVLARLRALCRDLLGFRLPDKSCDAAAAARTLGAAADLFYRLWLAADADCCAGVA
jgi:hypothetical protein